MSVQSSVSMGLLLQKALDSSQTASLHLKCKLNTGEQQHQSVLVHLQNVTGLQMSHNPLMLLNLCLTASSVLRLFIHRSTFSSLVLVITVITTVSSFVKPTANAYVLNCFGLHMLYILAVEMRWYENSGFFRHKCFWSSIELF